MVGRVLLQFEVANILLVVLRGYLVALAACWG